MTGSGYQYTPLHLHSHDMKLDCGWSDISDGMEWENLTNWKMFALGFWILLEQKSLR